MNYVKGTALKTMPEIIKKHFKQSGLDQWMGSLSEESRNIYSNDILINDWYPLEGGLVEPTVKYCILFYNWDFKGAWEMGRYSADFGLKRIHKVFLRIGTPHFLIKKASKILPSYYKSSRLDLVQLEKGRAAFTISDFPGINKVIKYRIGGWMERALEISGCRGVQVLIDESDNNENPQTNISVSWDI